MLLKDRDMIILGFSGFLKHVFLILAEKPIEHSRPADLFKSQEKVYRHLIFLNTLFALYVNIRTWLYVKPQSIFLNFTICSLICFSFSSLQNNILYVLNSILIKMLNPLFYFSLYFYSML